MPAPSSPARFGPTYSPRMVASVASCTAAISRLDARICVSSAASAWARRAAWSGYARALHLQAAEIDEIDVFSWGCGIHIPERPRRATNVDVFDGFPAWAQALREPDRLAWRDKLPVAVTEPHFVTEHPALVRALERVRQHARIDATIEPWLGLAFALRDYDLTTTPLPCLAGGAKALRLKRMPADHDWQAAVRSVEAAAIAGLDRLDRLERLCRDAQRKIMAEYRPGMLPALAALSCHHPVLSPQSVAGALGLTLAGASKLLARAASAKLLVEITRRRSWRIFVAADLAVDFGFVAPKRGRPPKEPPPLPPRRDLAEAFVAFDQGMEPIDALLASR